jgi:hypothetical protein
MVTLHLTNEQRATLGDLSTSKPVPIFDPSDNRAYFLVPADVYEQMRGQAGSEAEAPERACALMNEVAAREGWDDPEMDAYDQLDHRKVP